MMLHRYSTRGLNVLGKGNFGQVDVRMDGFTNAGGVAIPGGGVIIVWKGKVWAHCTLFIVISISQSTCGKGPRIQLTAPTAHSGLPLDHTIGIRNLRSSCIVLLVGPPAGVWSWTST